MGRRPKNNKSATRYDRIDQVVAEATRKANEMLHKYLDTSSGSHLNERLALLNELSAALVANAKRFTSTENESILVKHEEILPRVPQLRSSTIQDTTSVLDTLSVMQSHRRFVVRLDDPSHHPKPYRDMSKCTSLYNALNYCRKYTMEALKIPFDDDMWCIYCMDDPDIPYCAFCGCRKCHCKSDKERLLLCDNCDDEMHTYCASPPIERVPDGPWYCPKCIHTAGTSSATGSDGHGKKRKESKVRTPRADDTTLYLTKQTALQLIEQMQHRVLNPKELAFMDEVKEWFPADELKQFIQELVTCRQLVLNRLHELNPDVYSTNIVDYESVLENANENTKASALCSTPKPPSPSLATSLSNLLQKDDKSREVKEPAKKKVKKEPTAELPKSQSSTKLNDTETSPIKWSASADTSDSVLSENRPNSAVEDPIPLLDLIRMSMLRAEESRHITPASPLPSRMDHITSTFNSHPGVLLLSPHTSFSSISGGQLEDSFDKDIVRSEPALDNAVYPEEK